VTAHRVASLAEVPVSGALMVSVNDLEIGLFRVADQILAWRNHCPHMAAPVCRGLVTGTRLPSAVYCYELGLEGRVLQCPWHGWEFDLLTGAHLAGGSSARLRGYPVEVRGDDVFIHTRV
jgi:nitrite reductase (NADH) small subunit